MNLIPPSSKFEQIGPRTRQQPAGAGLCSNALWNLSSPSINGMTAKLTHRSIIGGCPERKRHPSSQHPHPHFGLEFEVRTTRLPSPMDPSRTRHACLFLFLSALCPASACERHGVAVSGVLKLHASRSTPTWLLDPVVAGRDARP